MLPPGAREACEILTRTELALGSEGRGRLGVRLRTALGWPAAVCVQARIVGGRDSSSLGVEAEGTGVVDSVISVFMLLE